MNLGGKRGDLGNGAKNGGFGLSGNGAALSIEGGGKWGQKEEKMGNGVKMDKTGGRNGEKWRKLGKKLGKLGKIWTELGGKVKKFGQKLGKLGTKSGENGQKVRKMGKNGQIWPKKGNGARKERKSEEIEQKNDENGYKK